MIHYEEIEPHLIDFLQGEVPEEVEYRIRAYLQQNPDFQQELDELEETLEFSQQIPLAQPAPELKMNFYAMLNEQKALQAAVRPSFRERMKLFLQTQFYWQTISVGVFSILLLVTGYWGLSVFQERFRNTEVALHKFEIEQNAEKSSTYIEIQMPKRKEAIAENRQKENAATQGRDADDALFEREIPTKTVGKKENLQEEIAKNEIPTTVNPNIAKGAYSFTDKYQDGVVTVNNPNGNINLMGYAGEEVKIETAPAQSYAGIVDNNHIIIDGLASAPQINMQVLLPQNRSLQVAVNAKQNIVMDLRGVQLQTNSSLTSQMGDVEVYASETNSLEINALARQVENDFEPAQEPFTNLYSNNQGMTNDAATNYKRPEANKALKKKDINEKPRKQQGKAKEKLEEAKQEKESVARSKNAETLQEDMEADKIANAPASPTNPPVLKFVKVPLKSGKNILQLNSPQGKVKIKKKN